MIFFWPILFDSRPAKRYRPRWRHTFICYATASSNPMNPNVEYWTNTRTGQVVHDRPADYLEEDEY